MTSDDFEAYLKDRYEDQLRWYSKKSSGCKKWYRWLQGIIFVLSAFLPVIAIVKPGHPWVIAVVASCLAALTAILKSFNFQEDWISYRATAENLKREKYYYDAKVGDYGTAKNSEQIFVEKVEGLISKENTSWTDAHLTKETESHQEES